MRIFETTKFSQQKSHNGALIGLRAAINLRLSELRDIQTFTDHSGSAISTQDAKKKILDASGGAQFVINNMIFEVPINHHWRIFFAQGRNNIIVLMVGHLQGNNLEQP